MPLPKEFTHTKWIAFFADLRSKISHHEPRVNVEGAELIRRLLLTQLGIAALLEEDYLLGQLCTKLSSLLDPSGRKSPEMPASEVEAAFSLLQCLSEIISLSVALFNDRDPYFCLLVVSRLDSTVLKMLTNVLRAHVVSDEEAQQIVQQAMMTQQQRGGGGGGGDGPVQAPRARTSPFLGMTISLVQTIISALPIGSFAVDVSAIVPTSQHHPSGAAVRHVTKMIALCRGEDALRELRDTAEVLVAAQSDLAPADGAADVSGGGAVAVEMALRAVHEVLASQMQHGATTFPDLAAADRAARIRRGVNAGFDRIRSARSHSAVHLGLNTVWCCLVADGPATCALLDASRLSCLERFVRTEPATEEDLALFRALLCFFAALCHAVEETPVETQRFLIDAVCPALVSMLRVYGNTASSNIINTGFSSSSSSSSAAAGTPLRGNNAVGAGHSPLGQQPLSAPQFLRSQAAPVQPVERPSPTLSILLLLHVITTSCRALRAEDIGRWVRAQGFFLRLVNLLEAAASTASPLHETPLAADGTLPDDRYLHAALETCRTDTTTSASVALKLVTELLLSYGPPLQGCIGTEVAALIKTALPLSVRVATHHPTMAIGRNAHADGPDAAAAVSMLHYVPVAALRSTRPCAVGESALLAVDTLVASAMQVEQDTGEQLVSFDGVAPWLPNLVRCSRDSVQPHLRTLVHRLLVRVCRTPQALRALVQQLPSFTSNAAEIVLHQSSRASWEVAGAAMWLSSVLRIANKAAESSGTTTTATTKQQQSAAANIPIDMLLVPALPRNLLKVASSMPPSYGAGALLQLLCALAERHRQQHLTSLPTNDEAALAKVLAGHAPDLVGSVVAPDGSASVTTWAAMLEQFTVVCRRTDLAPFGGDEVRSVTDDALFRARGALEEQTARTWYAAQLFHAVRMLVERHRDMQRAIPVDVLCDAVGSLLCAPLPSAVRSSLEGKFGVALPKPAQLLETTDDAVRSAVTLLRVFFDPAGVQHGVLPSISRTCLEGLCAVIGSVELGRTSRSLAAAFLSDMLSNAARQEAPRASIEAFAAPLFLATRSSPSSEDIPAIVGLRCRLVGCFEAANHAATSCCWLKECVRRLANAVRSVTLVHRPASRSSGNSNTNRDDAAAVPPPNEADHTEIQVSLSGIASVLALPECLPLERGDLVSCAASLLALLKLPWAQSDALRACRALANSAEGRSVLSCDLPTASSSSPLAAAPSNGALSRLQMQATKDVTSAIRAPFAKLVQITFLGTRPLQSLEDATCATDAVSLAVLREPDAFAPWLIKFKVLDSVSEMLSLSSRQKMLAPVSVYRFLASATAAEEMRVAVAHNGDVVELLLEAAEHVSPQGTLALMALRNLAFSAALKNQMCTNTAVMHLFKRVMWLMPPHAEAGMNLNSNSPHALSVGGGESQLSPLQQQHQQQQLFKNRRLRGAGATSSTQAVAALSPDATPEEVMAVYAGNLELFRRQELAASALWALVDGNQRAKSFIRNVLRAGRPCTLEEVRAQVEAVGPLSDLPGYPAKVLQTLDILESHGLSQLPPKA